jgi:hypothetical protein
MPSNETGVTVMTNELRSAAEDVLSHTFYDSSGIGMKAQAVAEAYRAEHPADEHELATIEWLESIPGIESEMSKSYNNVLWVSADKFDCVCLKFIFMDDKTCEIMLEEWVIYQGPVQTKREVRNMLAVFGIKERQ